MLQSSIAGVDCIPDSIVSYLCGLHCLRMSSGAADIARMAGHDGGGLGVGGYVAVLVVLFFLPPLLILFARRYKWGEKIKLELFLKKVPIQNLMLHNASLNKRPLNQQLESYLYSRTNYGLAIDMVQAALSLISCGLVLYSASYPFTEADPEWAVLLEIALTVSAGDAVDLARVTCGPVTSELATDAGTPNGQPLAGRLRRSLRCAALPKRWIIRLPAYVPMDLCALLLELKCLSRNEAALLRDVACNLILGSRLCPPQLLFRIPAHFQVSPSPPIPYHVCSSTSRSITACACSSQQIGWCTISALSRCWTSSPSCQACFRSSFLIQRSTPTLSSSARRCVCSGYSGLSGYCASWSCPRLHP